MKLSLVVGQGAHKGKVIPISLPQFVVGRDSKCHLCAKSQVISKRHCELSVREDRAFVKDLGSTNGTFVNNEPVRGERELHDGDLLKIGPLDFSVRFEVEAQVEKPTQVEKETQAPPPPPAEAEANGEAPTEALDDDAIGSMMLNQDEAGSTSDSAPGTTMMEVLLPQAAEDKSKQPYRPQVNKAAASENTSSAAKAILEKYRRRPRT